MTLKISIKLDKESQKQIVGVKNISKDIFGAVDTAMSSALDLILKIARKNVTGGIIGGSATPRRDGQKGLLSESLQKRTERRGRNLYGFVEIPPSSPGWIAGIVQEEGRGPIFSNFPQRMKFFYGDKTTEKNAVVVSKTSGIPASRWMTESFRQSRSQAEKMFKNLVSKVVKNYSKTKPTASGWVGGGVYGSFFGGGTE